MREFTKAELDRLKTCHPELRYLIIRAAEHINLYIVEGQRGEEAQNKAFKEGKSKLEWPHGKHNGIPSMAVDMAPYPVDWNNEIGFIYIGGFIEGLASALLATGKMTHQVRWGRDWDCCGKMHPQAFNDLGHFELI